ncbi:restriction endonuclease [Campylobacter sp. faydin G-105]|uniref:restriction endonuclease n=1 Tax=Campylobacter anatolicus TaxID=2829105 RepID=UPI001B9278A5|nr:restriction endonuclease [Campylobacter anatolicus]MBR8461475.1 restriction endonuclease [Campylobacter anatolicus]
MFINKQCKKLLNRYVKLLQIVASLSKLNSDKDEPYLYYRMAENIFCEAFEADNLARNDISIDAKKDKIGIGLKTFSHRNGRVLEKIAEFNKDLARYQNMNSINKCEIVSQLRNIRLNLAREISNVDDLIYHCVSRDKDIMYIHEEPMPLINLDKISIINENANTIHFKDNLNEYSFNISKSTLYKRFNISNLYEIKVNILQNPYEILEKLLTNCMSQTNPVVDSVVLALYSYDKEGYKFVPEKSGLNQWNAGGRSRDPNEIYIPIKKEIHGIKPNFFPPRDSSFSLKLPNGNYLMVKVCQDGSKALMSNPNLALGEWLLRDVLKIQKNTIVRYSDLQVLGIDSVEIIKYLDNTYAINFKGVGSYEEFLEQNS